MPRRQNAAIYDTLSFFTGHRSFISHADISLHLWFRHLTSHRVLNFTHALLTCACRADFQLTAAHIFESASSQRTPLLIYNNSMQGYGHAAEMCLKRHADAALDSTRAIYIFGARLSPLEE